METDDEPVGESDVETDEWPMEEQVESDSDEQRAPKMSLLDPDDVVADMILKLWRLVEIEEKVRLVFPECLF